MERSAPEGSRHGSARNPNAGRQHRSIGGLLLAVTAGFFFVVVGPGGGVSAQEEAQEDQRWDNEFCLGCHDVESLEVPLPSGEILNAVVDRTTYEKSVHGQLELPCVLCHTNIEGFPHPALTAQSRREFTLDLYQSCSVCHEPEYTATLDNVHAHALEEGNQEAAVCTDCHGSHDVVRRGETSTAIPLTCRACHSQIYDLYAESVHGAALFEEDNQDVPTCTDCHGVHSVEGPTDSPFHLFSPEICAECHADSELMGKYGISTEVFETYIADFHGTTVLLFEDLAPDQETNKPVCIDCHGVHHIVPAEDPGSSVFRENLLGTCQRCHPDATTNFPAAWLSHYQPTVEHSPLVFAARLFYKIIIPVVIGAMLAYVSIDGGRRLLRNRRRRRD